MPGVARLDRKEFGRSHVSNETGHILSASATLNHLRRLFCLMELLLRVLIAVSLFSSVAGFCGDRKLNGDLARATIKASEWLKSQVDENGTFGLGHVTAHGFHSLRLVGHEVNKISQLGAEYLGNELDNQGLDSVNGGRLALYILGVLSSCKNPRKFDQQQDLVQALQTKLSKYPTTGFDHPYPYYLAILALCTSGDRVSASHVDKLISGVSSQSGAGAHGVDTLAMGTIALSCIYRHQKDDKIEIAIKAAVNKFEEIQKNNSGKFGNEVSTSLAVQALLAAGVDEKIWNCAATMKSLLSMQNEDGSFVGVYDTIHTLPALIGALPYDVVDLPCPKDSVDKPKYIRVCIKLEFIKTNNIAPAPEYFTVLNGTNTHDIMKLAKTRHPCYGFTVKPSSWGHYITSICGVKSDHSKGSYWMIYTAPDKKAQYGIDHLKPQDGSCVIFKYEEVNWG